jgi:hypothetical protein
MMGKGITRFLMVTDMYMYHQHSAPNIKNFETYKKDHSYL